MRVTYIFNDENPDDVYKLKTFNQAKEIHDALCDFSEFLRTKLKHEELKEEEYDIYEIVKDEFFEIMNDNNVNLEL